jgi:hypothetical protein
MGREERKDNKERRKKQRHQWEKIKRQIIVLLMLLHISASNNGVTQAEYKKINTCRLHLPAVLISSLPVSVKFRAWLISPDHNMDIRATR